MFKNEFNTEALDFIDKTEIGILRYYNPARGSGKTTKAIKLACAASLKGKVLLVTVNSCMVKEIKNRIPSIFEDNIEVVPFSDFENLYRHRGCKYRAVIFDNVDYCELFYTISYAAFAEHGIKDVYMYLSSIVCAPVIAFEG